MLRIVSGIHRGKALSAPAGQATRPTSDRARQAVFNILEHAAWAPELRGARVMDLFAGSGALGFEALSRGASFCLFVETAAEARGVIRDNAEALGLFGHVRIHRRDATDLGVKPGADGAPFDLAFIDPPYRQGLAEKALASLAAGGWLAADAICMVETARDETLEKVTNFELLDRREYGAAAVHFVKFSVE